MALHRRRSRCNGGFAVERGRRPSLHDHFSQEPPATADTGTAVFDFTATLPASFVCFLDGQQTPDPCVPPVTYTGLQNGTHGFSVIATNTDAAGNSRNTKAARRWVVSAPPETTINEQPPALGAATSATFSFSSDQTGASFSCSLDNAAFSACSSPLTYSDLQLGQHTFQVRAVNGSFIDPTPAAATWTIAAPETTITRQPPASTGATSATFSFSSDQAGASFSCALDSAVSSACSSPQGYTDLSVGVHTFRVHAVAGNLIDPTPAAAAWAVTAVAPAPETTITHQPPASTEATSATFSFSSDQAGTSFECALDSAALSACSSPQSYSELPVDHHTFHVRAVNGNLADPTPAAASWTVTAATTPSGDKRLWLWIGPGIGAALVAAAAIALRWRHVRLTRRRGVWQLEADDREPPETCTTPESHTRRRNSKATPSLWKVEALTLSDLTGGGGGERELVGEAAERLNRALQARRTHSTEERLRELLGPVAQHVVDEIRRLRAGQPSPASVEVEAELAGSKFECEFTHFECVHHGGTSVWEKRDEWKGEVESKATAPVSRVSWPIPTGQAGGGVLARLEADLLAFVRRVDIPWQGR